MTSDAVTRGAKAVEALMLGLTTTQAKQVAQAVLDAAYPEQQEKHVDRIALEPLKNTDRKNRRLIERLSPSSPKIGKQEQMGTATYVEISDPHTMAECPYPERDNTVESQQSEPESSRAGRSETQHKWPDNWEPRSKKDREAQQTEGDDLDKHGRPRSPVNSIARSEYVKEIAELRSRLIAAEQEREAAERLRHAPRFPPRA